MINNDKIYDSCVANVLSQVVPIPSEKHGLFTGW